jgi:hypothetical protein
VRRRSAILLALTLLGGGGMAAATVSSAAPAYPPPCPTQPLVWQYQGNYYVSVPDPSGRSCHQTIEVPGSIKKPGLGRPTASPPITIPVPGFTACPPHQLVYESNGHDYVAAPDLTGKSCYTPVELPITVPPTLN